MTDIFAPLITLHQQVRNFVEAQYLGYKAITIDMTSSANYVPVRTQDTPATKQEIVELLLDPWRNMQPDSSLLLRDVQVSFRVQMTNGRYELLVDVGVAQKIGKPGQEELVIMRQPQISM